MTSSITHQIEPARIILASTSPYRAQALQQLGLPFTSMAPLTEEQAQPAEAPQDLAMRLAMEKTAAVAARCPDAIVIGSDQVGMGPDGLLHKPGTDAAATKQLQGLSGRVATFDSAVSVYNPQKRNFQSDVVRTTVEFRHLSAQQIERYVAIDQPLNCAGAFKVERLGIALFDRVTSDDPSALIGLPLIALTRLLEACGVDVLSYPEAPSAQP